MKWVAFFSQTGSEIIELSKALGRKPDLLVTNNFEEKIKFHPEVRRLDVTIQSARHSLLMDYFRAQQVFDPLSTLITLHGYLRIIPEDICNKYGILNGHPGLITLYPELKGKDPQIRAWEGKHPLIGSVVHQVIPEVDGGKIYKTVAYTNRCDSLDEMYGKLKQSSLESWVWTLKSYKELGCVLV
jgi:folate-dependent phosphoribosylglycinamide formyltransferase PurN